MNLKSSNIYEKMNQYSVASLSLAVIRNGKLDEATAFGTLEDITGRLFSQLLEEHIFQPLQMKNSTLFSPQDIDKTDVFACGHNKDRTVTNEKYPFYPFAAASGIWTTPTDLSALEGVAKLK